MNASPPPGVTLVIGPANSGKMGHMLAWWHERLSLKPVAVAPTGPDARGLSREMLHRAGGLVGQAAATTFDGLVRLVLGRSPRYATDLERRMIVSRLLRATRVEALEHAAHLPGVTAAVAALLQRLGESGRPPEELDRILTRWGEVAGDSAPLADDIRRLAVGYTQALADLGLADRPAVVREATQAARNWTRPVSLYGFTSFTPGQRTLVEKLSHGAEVLVTLPYDRSRSLNLSTPEEVAWWEARATQVVELASQARAYSSPAVSYLERHFMSDVSPSDLPPVRSGVEGVRFLLASGRRAEAELAAQQVADLIRAGFRPGDIAVLVRQVRTWSSLLRHVFDSCGIPCQVDDRCTLGETGLGHVFLSALRGVTLDDPDRILAFLRSPYSGVSLELVSDLELRYRRGTGRGVGVLAGLAEGMGLSDLKLLWQLVQPGDRGPRLGRAAAEKLCKSMLAAALHGSAVGSRSIEEDARAFRAMRAAFAAMWELAGGDGCSDLLEPQTVLGSLAQVAVPGSRSGDCDAVQVLGVRRARARRFAAVLILGLVEGEFPGRPDEPSLLSPVQQATLDSIGEGILAPQVEEEGALFVSAISRAWQVLFLSSRTAEDDGGEAVPSHLWESAKSLLRVGEHDHTTRGLTDQVFSPATAPSSRYYRRACAVCGCTPRSTVGRTIPGFSARTPQAAAFQLTNPDVLAELGASESFSPSALEGYVGCPFAWFVKRVIRSEDVEFVLDARLTGQLLHSALSAIYHDLDSAGLLPLHPAGVSEAERVAGVIIDTLVHSDQCPGTTADRRIAAWRLKRMARNLFDMESAAGGALVFSEAEAWIGGRRGIDIGGFCLRGRLDRLDTVPGEKGLFVIDYKSGSIPSSAAIGSEEGLQLPLYLMAVAAERPAHELLGGVYLALWEKKRAGIIASGSEEVLGSGLEGFRVLDQAAVADLWRTAREIALEAARGMRTGAIAPRPDRECPSWCRLGAVCRARRGGYRR